MSDWTTPLSSGPTIIGTQQNSLDSAPASANVPDQPRCYSYSDKSLDEWLNVKELDNDVVLQLTGIDVYNSHTALRHGHDLANSKYAVHVLTSLELRKHKGFTPWFAKAKTKYRGHLSQELHNHLLALEKDLPDSIEILRKKQCILTLDNVSVPLLIPAPHMAAMNTSLHYATFDLRIAGNMQRTLTDTGATCCCMTESYRKAFDLPFTPQHEKIEDIGGVGGKVNVLGMVTTTVKMGKEQIIQEFLVVSEPIAGYHCLLGQDFLAAQSCGILFTPSTVSLTINGQEGIAGPVICKRKIPKNHDFGYPHHDEVHTNSKHKVNVIGSKTGTKCAKSQNGDTGNDTTEQPTDKPLTGKEKRAMKRDLFRGDVVGYRIYLAPLQAAETPKQTELPACIQQIIDKHSTGYGTLRGSIPPHTHVKGYECHIELVPGAKSVQIRQYRLTPREQQELEEKVRSFIDQGWIEPSVSGWSSSVLFVPKPGGKLRFCVDYRRLNAVTQLDKSPIPLQEEMLDKLHGAHYFSALDLASGFYQLSIDEESRPLTAFPTSKGQYQWKVMPMGLTNAPAIFQKAMTAILDSHIRGGYCLVYIDDIIIYSKSLEEHAKHLDTVLTSLKDHNLFCQLPKCVWAQTEIKYLGHIVNAQGVKPDPGKVKALENWGIPPDCTELSKDNGMSTLEKATIRKRTVHEVRRFLGFMNYFSRFIPRYAELAGPLHAQTSDKAVDWNDECTANWNTLKTLLIEATMMYHPDFAKTFHVYPDASMLSIGGCLIQFNEGISQPVAYIARKLLPAEQRYSTTEQEMLALVYCFQKWRCYLDGTDVVVHTDHEPLTWLQTQVQPSHRQARWLEYLSRFNFKLAYIRGDKNVVADALSRMLHPLEESDVPMPADIWPPSNDALNYTGTVHTGISDTVNVQFRIGRGSQGEGVIGTASARRSAPTHLHTNGETPVSARNNSGVTASTGSAKALTDPWERYSKKARTGTCDASTNGSSAIVREVCYGGTSRSGMGTISPRSSSLQCAPGWSVYHEGGNDEVTANDSCTGHHHAAFPQRPQASGASTQCILTIVRSIAVGGHTRARSRRVPVWEEGESSQRGVHLFPRSKSHTTVNGNTDTVNGNTGTNTTGNTVIGNNETNTGNSDTQARKESEELELEIIPKNQVTGKRDRSTGHIDCEIIDHPDSNLGNDQIHSEKMVGHQNSYGLVPGGEKPQGGSDPSLSSYDVLLIQLLSRVKTGYMTDSIAQDAISRKKLGLTQHNELLWKGHLLYIPEDIQLKHDILYWHHDVPWCAHLGIAKTLELVKRQFYWPKMENDISQYVKTCQSCQTNKVDRRLNRPPLYPNLLAEGCWRTVGIDLITDLPVTASGNDTIVHFIDHLSKMSRPLAARKSITSKGVAKLYFREIFPHYGMPLRIISDRDRRWNNEFFSELCRLVGIKLNLSTAAHPQSNGLTERGNEVITTGLRHFTAADQRDWDDWLPFVEFAINSTYKESIKCTPFEMNRITMPRNPFDAMMAHVIQGQTVNAETTTFMGINSLNDPYQNGARTAIQAHAVFQWARKCLEISKQHMQMRHASGRESYTEYQIGDMVWFSVSNLELKHPARRHKLLPKYIGPLKVIDIAGHNAVKLDMPKYLAIHPIVSTTQVKLYHSRDGTVPPVIIDEKEAWEVDNIVNHNIFGKKNKSKVEFQVQWKGNAKDSWHEFQDLLGCIDTLEKYLLQNCSPVKRSQILKLLKPTELALLSNTVTQNLI